MRCNYALVVAQTCSLVGTMLRSRAFRRLTSVSCTMTSPHGGVILNGRWLWRCRQHQFLRISPPTYSVRLMSLPTPETLLVVRCGRSSCVLSGSVPIRVSWTDSRMISAFDYTPIASLASLIALLLKWRSSLSGRGPFICFNIRAFLSRKDTWLLRSLWGSLAQSLMVWTGCPVHGKPGRSIRLIHRSTSVRKTTKTFLSFTRTWPFLSCLGA